MIREGESRCKEKTRENSLFFGVFYGAGLEPHTPERFALLLRRSSHGRFAGSVLAGREETQYHAQFAIRLGDQFRIVLQELPGAVSALPDPLCLIAEPRTALLHQIARDAQVQEIAFAGSSQAVQNVELGLAERRRDFCPSPL